MAITSSNLFVSSFIYPFLSCLVIVLISNCYPILLSIIEPFIVIFQHYYGVLPLTLPLTCRRWHNTLTHTFPDWSAYPKSFLSEQEQDFVEWLLSHRINNTILLRSNLEVAEQAQELWSEVLADKSLSSIATNLCSGKSYLNREYRLGKRRIGLWLFAKGLLFKFRVPTPRAPFKYEYCYPCFSTQPISLNGSSFEVPYPPHDYFSSLCVQVFRDGISPTILRQLPSSSRVIPHWDGSGDFVADICYRLDLFGQSRTLWVEVHTGSEGYDLSYFLRRLLTMEQYLTDRPADRFLVIVPFLQDVATAQRSIEKYNASVSSQQVSTPALSLARSSILCFNQIPAWKESFGFYQHRTR